METIKLKEKKKKVILWKRILILLISIITIWVISNIKISYRYYIINPDTTTTQVGISANNRLVNETVLDYIQDIKMQDLQIADFNLQTAFDNNIIITFGTPKYNDNEIKNIIKEETYVIVYASKITIGDNVFYTKPNYSQSTIDKIKKINSKLDIQQEYVYVNSNNLWYDAEIEDYLEQLADIGK